MKNKMIKVFFLVLILSTIVFSQQPAQPVENHPVQTEDSKQVAVLKAQLDEMRKYDERLISTVQWSIGLSLGILGVVLTLGWIANFRLYKRDVEDLKKEFLASIKNDFNNELKAIKEKLQVEQDKVYENLKAEVRSITNAQYQEVQKLKFQLLKAAADKHLSEGVHANVFDRSLEMLALAKEMNSRLEIVESLTYLKNSIKNGAMKWSHQVNEVSDSIESLENNYKIETDLIQEYMKEKVAEGLTYERGRKAK